ncbi:hypothetical protein LDO31_10450 [Luteimonas sp. XNQY3]|nr:hypothetical protein [Luteimonas sp. XNQY3]MCD9006649.1 hypothetical protein [Luteimonas sp. XNQY3]
MALLSCAAAIALAVRSGRRIANAAVPAARDEPLLHAARERAQTSIDDLRPYVGSPLQVGVKIPLRNGADAIEHVWGTPESIDAASVTLRIVTPFVDGATPAGPVTVAVTEIEDWQVFLDDGRILGGFGTRAQITVARRDGHPIPEHVLAQEARFVDA